jgi:hypothetical protein
MVSGLGFGVSIQVSARLYLGVDHLEVGKMHGCLMMHARVYDTICVVYMQGCRFLIEYDLSNQNTKN